MLIMTTGKWSNPSLFSWEPVIKYINDQYLDYLTHESKEKRDPVIPDTRIHCVLYFIEPTGHS
jgi:septin family protein